MKIPPRFDMLFFHHMPASRFVKPRARRTLKNVKKGNFRGLLLRNRLIK